MTKQKPWFKILFNWSNLLTVGALPLLLYLFSVINPCRDWDCLGYVIFGFIFVAAIVPYAVLVVLFKANTWKSRILTYVLSIFVGIGLMMLYTRL